MPNVSDHTLRKATVTFTVTTGKIRYSQRLMYALSVFQMYPIDQKISILEIQASRGGELFESRRARGSHGVISATFPLLYRAGNTFDQVR